MYDVPEWAIKTTLAVLASALIVLLCAMLRRGRRYPRSPGGA